DLGEITIEPVSSRYAKASKAWSALMEAHHYLGRSMLGGAQIRYLVKSSKGYLGALSFRSGSWALRERETYIGWAERDRRAYLQEVGTNDSCRIRPREQ